MRPIGNILETTKKYKEKKLSSVLRPRDKFNILVH